MGRHSTFSSLPKHAAHDDALQRAGRDSGWLLKKVVEKDTGDFGTKKEELILKCLWLPAGTLFRRLTTPPKIEVCLSNADFFVVRNPATGEMRGVGYASVGDGMQEVVQCKDSRAKPVARLIQKAW